MIKWTLGLMFILLVIPTLAYSENTNTRILVLNSYHKGFPWTDDIVRGVESVLNPEKNGVELIVEYMDTKSMGYGQEYKRVLHDLYLYKYHGQTFDLIISSDDNALNFLREYRDELFPGSRVVFCGVNNRKVKDIIDNSVFTGILETTAHEETIDVLLKLHPKTKKIYLVIDNELSGEYQWERLQPSLSRYEDIEFIRISNEYSIEEIEDILHGLTDNSAVMFFTLNHDSSGKYLSLKEGVTRVTNASTRPVYTTHQLDIPYGVIGGKVLGGFHQGESVAIMALRILSGEKIANLPVVETSPTQYVFNYQQLEKWGIKHSDLPDESIILNMPASLYNKNKGLIWTVVFTILALLAIIFFLEMNIMRRKKAEENLRESEERFRLAFEKAHDGICLVDLSGKILKVNQQMCEIFGYSSLELESMTVNDIAHTVDKDVSPTFMKKCINGETESAKFEKRYLHKEGSVISAEVSSTMVKDSKGIPLYFVSHIRNITRQKEADVRIDHQQQIFKAIIDNIPVLINLYDSNTKVQLVNKAFEETVGWTNEEIQIIDIMEVCFPDPIYRAEALEYMEKASNEWREFTVSIKNGGTIDSMWSNVRLEDDTQIGIGIDITEKKRLEANLNQAYKMESVGTLAGGIAHDFNNILSAIIGFTELASAGVDKDSPAYEDLREVHAAGLRAKDLVKQILTFARQSDESLKPVQVDIIAQEVLKFIRSTIPTTIEIRQSIESGSRIMGSPTQVHQIIINLCTNAAHAMEDKGGILGVTLRDVSIDRSTKNTHKLKFGDYLKIEISDTGCGIEPHIVDRIFDPYFTTKSPGEGTGMGLALVHGIVETYKGKVFVKSILGKGTDICIYLPICKESVDHVSLTSEILPRGQERILFVDDEVQIAQIGSRMLSQLGYSVTIKNNSLDALELFRSNSTDFDLIISDVTMPKMTGDQLAENLIQIRPDIPIILCTGYSNKISEDKALQIGVKAIAYKPIVKEDLAKTVRRVLDEAHN